MYFSPWFITILLFAMISDSFHFYPVFSLSLSLFGASTLLVQRSIRTHIDTITLTNIHRYKYNKQIVCWICGNFSLFLACVCVLYNLLYLCVSKKSQTITARARIQAQMQTNSTHIFCLSVRFFSTPSVAKSWGGPRKMK